MNDEAMHPLEVVLRQIAAVAPQPWYPRAYAQKAGIPLDGLLNLLEQLWLDGLIRKGEGTPETGPGVLLSPVGAEVLDDPELLRRLREGEPINPDDPGAVIRNAFQGRQRTPVTKLLLWTTILWFAYGLYLAHSRHNAAGPYLSVIVQGAPALISVYHQIGSVYTDDIIRGEWWRLLTCNFVHYGLLDIALSLIGIYAVGRTAERMWGGWRLLVLYLLSAIGGSVAAIAYRPATMVVAIGALTGMLATELAWMAFNGRYLPRALRRRWWWGIVANLVIFGVLAATFGGGYVGQIGGVVAGGVGAWLLNVQRFGRGMLRWAPLVPLAGLLWVGYETIQRQRVVSVAWQEAEERVFAADFTGIYEQARAAHGSAMSPRADLSLPKKLAAAAAAREQLTTLQKRCSQTGRFCSKEVEARRVKMANDVSALLKEATEREEELRPLAEKEEKRLAEEERKRKQREVDDAKEEGLFARKFLKRVNETTGAAERVFAEKVLPLVKMPSDQRNAAELAAVRKAVTDQRAALAALARELKEVGEYHSDDAEKGRRFGRDYAVELEKLLGLSEKRLDDPSAEPDWRRLNITVEQRRSDWKDWTGEK